MNRLILPHPLHGGHVAFESIEIPRADLLGKASEREESVKAASGEMADENAAPAEFSVFFDARQCKQNRRR
jgi:hypothetical protein